MIDRILTIWSRLETILIGLCLIASLGIFMGGAIVRAVAPSLAVDWAEEVSIYFIIWATALSGSVLMYEKRHISTAVFTSLVSAKIQRILAITMLLTTLGFCAVMAVYGWQAVQFTLLIDERSASTLRTPQAYALFLALPVGMALIVLRLSLMILGGTRSISGDMAFATPDEDVKHD